MTSLLGIIFIYLVALRTGKKGRPLNFGTFLLLLLFAIAQTGILLFDMFTRKIPTP
ncbi:MAG: hypothetical protein ACHQQQ_02330 [Bacteroidota bacterium]